MAFLNDANFSLWPKAKQSCLLPLIPNRSKIQTDSKAHKLLEKAWWLSLIFKSKHYSSLHSQQPGLYHGGILWRRSFLPVSLGIWVLSFHLLSLILWQNLINCASEQTLQFSKCICPWLRHTLKACISARKYFVIFLPFFLPVHAFQIVYTETVPIVIGYISYFSKEIQ